MAKIFNAYSELIVLIKGEQRCPMLQSHRMARDEIQRVISALKVINAAQNHPAIHELEIQDDLVSVLMDQTKRLKQVEKYFSQSCEDEIPNA